MTLILTLSARLVDRSVSERAVLPGLPAFARVAGIFGAIVGGVGGTLSGAAKVVNDTGADGGLVVVSRTVSPGEYARNVYVVPRVRFARCR